MKKNFLEEEKLIELLSTLFVVPKREVIIRGKELGYNFDIDYLNAKTRKLVNKKEQINLKH